MAALSSEHSSPGDSTSFYSVPEGNSTTASSPLNSDPSPYREARQFGYTLKQAIKISLEEKTYLSGLNLCRSALAAGASKRKNHAKPRPVPIPPPRHLALIATLAVHPEQTTRAEKGSQTVVSSHALDYLCSLLRIVGPLHADFRDAFQFLHLGRPGRRSGYNSHGNNSDLSDCEAESDAADRLRGKLANESSLWHRGRDLWSVLGWALNCSSLYPQRWRYWKPWLEFMADVLEADWRERERQDLDAYEADGSVGEVPLTLRHDSMIAMYMDEPQGGRRGSPKLFVKAILADGSDLSSAAFPEVFEKEPRGRKKESRKRKRESINIESGNFGDYLDDDAISSGGSEPPTPQKARSSGRPPRETTFGEQHAGFVESIDIRLRLFKLLSLALWQFRKLDEMDDLYIEFAAGLRLLSLPAFALVVTQRQNALIPETHTTVLKALFHHLLSRYKQPALVDPEAEQAAALSSIMLARCYALHAANSTSAEDNAKLSIAIESALQLIWMSNKVGNNRELRELVAAVETGIAARENKVKVKRKSGKNTAGAAEAMAQDMLSNSSERLRMLLDVIQATHGAAA
ncbi:uncharacterized protein J7T54_006151 [Emericellopsis cladophorae]|uniref:Uncharacterized protein n=1 Tax=Emericellopsis cladophorae TaxID=2686198 RepID=A0A9Q0BHR3_9HYPO|nr:uncharacterized protein J7T54_006151 [Emericellopsis cladophorae]KAI6785812.1 hypothetical protein J7T54_006151 [Emericellopsis cladophorae]